MKKEILARYSKLTTAAVGVTLALSAIGGCKEENRNPDVLPPLTTPLTEDYQGPSENTIPFETSPPFPTPEPTEIPITQTPTPIQTPIPTLTPNTRSARGIFSATHYGVSYNGRPLGCGTGLYSSENSEIAAVAPSRYLEWPCGTRLQITNPANGATLNVVRHDACPGCGHNTIDLSEKGLDILCGKQDCGSLSGLIVEKLG